MNARPPATTARTPRLRRILAATVLTAGLAVAGFAVTGPDTGPATGPQQAATTGTVRVGTPAGTNAVVRGSSWALPATTGISRGTVTSLARGSSWS